MYKILSLIDCAYIPKMSTLKKYIGVIVFFSFSGCAYCQTLNEEKDFYIWFDEMAGIENANLYEGTVHVQKYATLDGEHKFYKTFNYLNGHIVYNGEAYFNIDMKYDIYEDEILLALRSSSRVMMLQLIKERIKEFVIDERRFIGMENESSTTFGFYEALMETSFFTFLKKHKKIRYPSKKNILFHRFVIKNEYYLNYKQRNYNIRNKKDIIKIFPQYKTSLNKFSMESLRKTDKDEYLLKLLDVVHNNLQSEKTL
ncbi:hypothetical protein [Flagellimonas pacifica]|uniref:Uncharacterized protein n=1 Tax=Flagellimonas pacifica TaxID=1247520 RepID=A0A285MUV7_9FLAO|nr:hypothetical protein [Allomuricauda parva]SNZ00483.1 hypothetical protein SAMN06265377_2307 [Allomuricauda parva]